MGNEENRIADSKTWVIETKGVTKSFGNYRALRGIDLQVDQGKFLVIFGPNGAGKTTLLRVLATLLKPSAGTLRIAGLNIQDDAARIRRKIGVVTHQTLLYDELTAYENLRFYGRMYSVPNLEERIHELIDRVGLTARLNDRVHTFSRGMQQRLSIARALIHNPSIVLLDEPETGLDKYAIVMLGEIIKTSSSNERTMVMTTHSLERGLEMGNHIAIMAKGKIAYEESRKSLNLASLQEAFHHYTGARQ